MKDIKSILTNLKRFMTIVMNKKGFNNIYFKINKPLFDNITIINKVVDRTFKKFRKDKHFFLLCKIFLQDGRILTLHKGIVVMKSDKDNYLDFLLKNLNEKEDFYQLLFCKAIIFDHHKNKIKMLKIKSNFIAFYKNLKKDLLDVPFFYKLWKIWKHIYYNNVTRLLFKLLKYFLILNLSVGTIIWINLTDFSIYYNIFAYNMPDYHDILQNIYKYLVNILDKFLNYFTDLLDKPELISKEETFKESLSIIKDSSIESLEPSNNNYSIVIIISLLCIPVLGNSLYNFIDIQEIIDIFVDLKDLNGTIYITDIFESFEEYNLFEDYDSYFKSPNVSPKDLPGSIELKSFNDLTPKALSNDLPRIGLSMKR